MALDRMRSTRGVATGAAHRPGSARSVSGGPLEQILAFQRLAGNGAVSTLLTTAARAESPVVQRQPAGTPSATMTPAGDGELDVLEQEVRELVVDKSTASGSRPFHYEVSGKNYAITPTVGPLGPRTKVTIRGSRPGTEILKVLLVVDGDPVKHPLPPVEFSVHPGGSYHGVGALGTWGDSTWETDTYARKKGCGGGPGEGVTIALRFKPGRSVDAETIALAQTVKAQQRGAAYLPSAQEHPEAAGTIGTRSIPAGQPGAGAHIDPSGEGTQESAAASTNPLYASDAGELNGATTLEGAGRAETRDQYGEHGWRYRDDTGRLHVADAVLKDEPCLASPGPNSGQIFETTALAVQGAQRGTYYGSVQWGWQTDAAGTYSRLPLTRVSEDAPSPVFAEAAGRWNLTPTSEGQTAIPLPVVRVMSTLGKVPLMRVPSAGGKSMGTLESATQLQVSEGRDPVTGMSVGDWRRVSLIDGPLAGRVGWVLAKNLYAD